MLLLCISCGGWIRVVGCWFLCTVDLLVVMLLGLVWDLLLWGWVASFPFMLLSGLCFGLVIRFVSLFSLFGLWLLL